MTMMNSELYIALKSAGAAEAEAQAAASSVLSAQVGASKADLAELRADITEWRAATKADLAELRADITEWRAASKADLAELRAATRDETAQLRSEFYRVIAGQTVVLVGIMAALKLFN